MKASLLFKHLGAVLVMICIAVMPMRASLLPLDLPEDILPTRLQWDASPSPTVAGYAVYYMYFLWGGLPIQSRIDAGQALSVILPLLIGEEYLIYVVAYEADGAEGTPSDYIYYTPPPLTGLSISQHSDDSVRVQFRTSPLAVCVIEYTERLGAPDWKQLSSVSADVEGNVSYIDTWEEQPSARFYRVVRL